MCQVGKLNKNKTKPSRLSVGSTSWLIISQKSRFSLRTRDFISLHSSLGSTDERGSRGPSLLSQKRKPLASSLWQAAAFACLPKHLIINPRTLMADSLNTPEAQPEPLSLLAPPLSPFTWALPSLPSCHFSLSILCRSGSLSSLRLPLAARTVNHPLACGLQ